MSKIKEIMTSKPFCLSENANVFKARMLMSEKSIRHIPIVNPESKELVGMLSQKAVLSNAIKIINRRGLERLEHEEKSIGIASIMDTDPACFDVDESLIDVANALLTEKSGCVVISENKKVTGVVTSNDFVKLALKELGPSTC